MATFLVKVVSINIKKSDFTSMSMCEFLSLRAADMVLDHQEASNELDDSVRVKVREALLKRHHHQNDKKKNLIPIVRSIAEGNRKHSEPHLAGGTHTVLHMQTHIYDFHRFK